MPATLYDRELCSSQDFLFLDSVSSNRLELVILFLSHGSEQIVSQSRLKPLIQYKVTLESVEHVGSLGIILDFNTEVTFTTSLAKRIAPI